MKITVTIHAITTDQTETSETSQTVCGFLRQSENSLEIAYREPAGDESLGNTRTMLRLYADHLELQRQGDYGGLLIMEPGCTHTCDYITPFGPMPMDVTTSAYVSNVCADGTGNMAVRYTLAAGGEATKHELCVTVTPLAE